MRGDMKAGPSEFSRKPFIAQQARAMGRLLHTCGLPTLSRLAANPVTLNP